MKGLAIPFDFDSSYFFKKNHFLNNNNNSFPEPTSVLDSTISGGPTSSSSHGGSGGGGSTDTAGVGAVSDTNPSPISSNYAGGADSEIFPVAPPSAAAGGGGSAVEWEGVLSDVYPSQEQSVFRWAMGDIAAVAGGGGGCVAAEFDFGGGGGFGVVDQGDPFGANLMMLMSNATTVRSVSEKTNLPSDAVYPAFDLKPPNLLINQQTQNPSFFLPEQTVFVPPPAKRLNLGGPINEGTNVSFPHHYPQLLPDHLYLQQRPIGPPGTNPKTGVGDELGQQQTIIDQLYNVAELVQTGNLLLAQGILARLNHSLSPIGNPFNRAAFYCKEALHLLLQTNNSNCNITPALSPISLILKIGAFKCFSEISPVVEFANFTCNQALLEAFEGFDRIHVVDFEIGYGCQWASLMQELALRSGGPPSLKITAFASQSTHVDQLELSLARENLIQFASEVNIEFEFEVLSIDCLSSGLLSLHFHASENEAVGVNLPISCLADHNLSLPLILRLVKQMSTRIVVSVDRGCDRTDLPFANHIIHALQSYSNLLESLDAVNVNFDALQKIERFLFQPGFEKIVMGRFCSPEKSQHWRSLFLSSGFSQGAFSNFAESQAECVVKRTRVRGFHVEKRQSSLVLSWLCKELVSVSVWKC